MDDETWAVIIVCVGAAIACFLVSGLYLDIAEWWSNRNAKS